MLLSGEEIQKNLGGNIIIEPYHPSQLNPNSYNLRLSNELLVYDTDTLDMKANNPVRHLTIPDSGLLLETNKLYLGRTLEYTKTEQFVPMLEGRSSVGRLGLFIHVTAGFGDVGFAGYWTLEMFCIHPIVIYPNVEICQIYYHTIQGEYQKYDSGKYQNNTGVQPSMLRTAAASDPPLPCPPFHRSPLPVGRGDFSSLSPGNKARLFAFDKEPGRCLKRTRSIDWILENNDLTRSTRWTLLKPSCSAWQLP